MHDLLAILMIAVIGSAVWFAVQFACWFFGVKSRESFERAQRLIRVALVASPIFVALVQFVLFVVGPGDEFYRVVYSPLIAVWVISVSWAALRITGVRRGFARSGKAP
jgi:hypothetical protein